MRLAIVGITLAWLGMSTPVYANLPNQDTILLVRTKPGDLLNQGVDNLNRGNYQQAIATLTNFINLPIKSPYLVYGHINRGIAYQKLATGFNKQGNNAQASINYEKAILDYNKAIELNCCNSTAVRAHLNRGILYYERGNQTEDQRDYQLANSDFNQVILILQNHIGTSQAQTQFGSEFIGLDVAYLLMGDTSRAMGDIEGAIDLYSKAIDNKNWKNLTALLNRGSIYYEQKDYEKAISDFQRVIQLQKDQENLLKSNSFNLSEAEKSLELQKLHGQIAVAHSNIGGIYLVQGKLDEAIKDLEKAVNYDSNNADAHYNLGLAYMSKGDDQLKDLAQASFRRAAQIYKANGEIDRFNKVEEQLTINN